MPNRLRWVRLRGLPRCRSVVLAAAAFALAAVIACGSADGSPLAESASPGSLVVYSGRSESLVGPIIDQFGEATGVKVRVKYGSTSELAATLQEEGKNTPADVFFGQDAGGLGAVSTMLAPLPDDLLALVPEWASSHQSRWVGVSGRARVVVYNRFSVPEDELPASLQDLTDPR